MWKPLEKLEKKKSSKTRRQFSLFLSLSVMYFGNAWVDWANFVFNVLIDILRNGKFTKWFLGLNDEYRGYVEMIYLGALECLFTKAPNEIWDFFKYMTLDTWEYENARETFSDPILTLMLHMLHL